MRGNISSIFFSIRLELEFMQTIIKQPIQASCY